jgi:hypothetical protein
MASTLLPRRMFTSLSLVVLFLVDSTLAGCFLPNGTDINKLRGGPNEDYFLPCGTGSGDSMYESRGTDHLPYVILKLLFLGVIPNCRLDGEARRSRVEVLKSTTRCIDPFIL